MLRKLRRTLRGRSAIHRSRCLFDLLARISQHSPSEGGERATCSKLAANALSTEAFDPLLGKWIGEKNIARAKSINLWRIYDDTYFFKYHPDKSLAAFLSRIFFRFSLFLSCFPIRLFRSPPLNFRRVSFSFSPSPKRRCVDVQSSATIRCLNINPSTEVGSFQFRSRDRSSSTHPIQSSIIPLKIETLTVFLCTRAPISRVNFRSSIEK